ncbi:hypothetical protein NKI95_18120 [Mesorhizobium sp. M0306]|uniref:hypothetical protein n=1 Tax=Mesorhizobium sp. M0306 TaxID=2956932 RepID=UPI00333AFBF1
MTNALPVKTAPETGERLRPRYVPRAEAITVQRAIDLFRHDYNVSEDTLRRLVIKHRLHNQTMPGAPWRISAPGLALSLAGDDDALARLRQDVASTRTPSVPHREFGPWLRDQPITYDLALKAIVARTGHFNQGWKDSADAIFHTDGTVPKGPIALVEVQGYVFAAYQPR